MGLARLPMVFTAVDTPIDAPTERPLPAEADAEALLIVDSMYEVSLALTRMSEPILSRPPDKPSIVPSVA